MAHHVACLIFPGFQILDVTGPIAAFEVASQFWPGAYTLDVRAVTPGPVKSSSGVCLQARSLRWGKRFDSLLVAGGNGTRQAAQCRKTTAFIQRAARHARIASVCSGTFLLAAAGLLEGRSATTHWSRSRDFQRRFPGVHLEPDRIFVRAGNVWTSAGISAGIDLALELITRDFGEAVAKRTAQELVVYYRRPGGQSQYSQLLELQGSGRRFDDLLDHVRARLGTNWNVEQLARRAAMSPRNFARVFRREVGLTPARAVEGLRLEAARAALQSGAESLAEVSQRTGFGDAERMRRAFQRRFGIAPSALCRKGPRTGPSRSSHRSELHSARGTGT